MRVLLTNNTLVHRSGTELCVRDVALELKSRGHQPIAYSPLLGDIADELRAHGIPAVHDLSSLAVLPDVIHGHHHLETMTALLHFSGVPAISFCHGCVPWEEEPAIFPRVHRYVAVSEACRDRLLCEHGIPPERIRVLLNFVDLRRFRQRPPLPPRPRRALVFSNYATEENLLKPIRDACRQRDIALEVIGHGAGKGETRPEDRLGGYDLIFASGRCALEALAVGAAVVLCKPLAAGPLVTRAEVERLRAQNLGQRALFHPLASTNLLVQIDRYDAHDAAQVTDYIRATAGCAEAVESMITLYQEAVNEVSLSLRVPTEAELLSTARYLRRLAPRMKQVKELLAQRGHLEAELTAVRDRLQAELTTVRTSLAFRASQSLLNLPGVPSLANLLLRLVGKPSENQGRSSLCSPGSSLS